MARVEPSREELNERVRRSRRKKKIEQIRIAREETRKQHHLELREHFARLIEQPNSMQEGEHQPTEAMRLLVQHASGIGFDDKEIAKLMAIPVETLVDLYEYELRTGTLRMTLEVSQTLYSIATDRKHPGAVSAAKHWLAIRSGWTETSRLEVTGRDGEALGNGPIIDSRRLTVEEREVLRALLLKTSEPPYLLGNESAGSAYLLASPSTEGVKH